MILPHEYGESDAWRVIVDPIDGTRGHRRDEAAWILTGAKATRPRNKFAGHCPGGTDRDPLVKQHLCDALGGPRRGRPRRKAQSSERRTNPLLLRPSRSTSIRHGCGTGALLPGRARGPGGDRRRDRPRRARRRRAREGIVSRINIYRAAASSMSSSPGMIVSIADLRPLMEPLLRARGLSLGICCHPYDLCTELTRANSE